MKKSVSYVCEYYGEEFKNKVECLMHEKDHFERIKKAKYESLKDDIHLLNADFDEISFEQADEGHRDFEDDVYAIKCDSLEAVNFMSEWFKEKGLCNPYDKYTAESSMRCLYFEEAEEAEDSEWVLLEDKIANIESLLFEYNKAYDKLLGY